MHLPDGIISTSLCLPALATAGGASLWALRALPDRQLPRVAMLTAAFFAVGGLHVRVPGGSVHFLLTGLLACMLGRRAIAPITIGVALQALLLQHGGILTLGVNALVLALPAVAVGALALPAIARATPRFAGLIAAAATIACYAGSMTLFLVLVAWQDAGMLTAVLPWVALHAPTMALEALMSAVAVGYLARFDRGALQPCYVSSS